MMALVRSVIMEMNCSVWYEKTGQIKKNILGSGVFCVEVSQNKKSVGEARQHGLAPKKV